MNTLTDLAHLQESSIEELPELPGNMTGDSDSLAEHPRHTASTVIVSGIEKHDYYAAPAVRSKVALTNTGILYLAEGARSDVLVRSYVAALDRLNRLSEGKIVPYTRLVEVPYTEIQQLYADSTEDESSRRSSARGTAEESQIKSIIAEAVQEQASDIFFEVYDGAAEIHYRIAGDIERRFRMKPQRAVQLIRTVYDAMSEATSDSFYDPSRDQSGRIDKRHISELDLHQIRISCGPTDEERPFMALRLHYKLGEPRRLVELGFSQEHQAAVDAATEFSDGIILFSGPTGSGKSTSLANQIGHYQKRDNWIRKVITLEDPPEIPIHGALHKAVLRKGLDRAAEGQAWLAGFETLMRWNPDWIIAGELRLRETMDAALKSALTNHLTWGMLHASSATHVLTRLQESGIELGYLCDPAIFRVFSNQSLVPQVCPHCSTPYTQSRHKLSAGLQRRVERFCTPETVRVRGEGCAHCYRGALRVRTIVAEVLTTNDALLSVYRKGGATALRRSWVREHGGKTKTAHMIDKINAGILDPANAERFVTPLNEDDRLWKDGS